jgi:hypothetical protein
MNTWDAARILRLADSVNKALFVPNPRRILNIKHGPECRINMENTCDGEPANS